MDALTRTKKIRRRAPLSSSSHSHPFWSFFVRVRALSQKEKLFAFIFSSFDRATMMSANWGLTGPPLVSLKWDRVGSHKKKAFPAYGGGGSTTKPWAWEVFVCMRSSVWQHPLMIKGKTCERLGFFYVAGTMEVAVVVSRVMSKVIPIKRNERNKTRQV